MDVLRTSLINNLHNSFRIDDSDFPDPRELRKAKIVEAHHWKVPKNSKPDCVRGPMPKSRRGRA